jgi:uncharacterized protein
MDLAPALSAVEMIERLSLRPHPEGGFFRETFRAARETETPRGPRSLATGILFLLPEGSRSRFHRLRSEELWMHQAGAPVELITLPVAVDRSPETIVLATPAAPSRGSEPADQCRLQAVVPAAVWQAARVVPADAGPGWSLCACIVVPGFDYADFELAEREALLRAYPAQAELIRRLT